MYCYWVGQKVHFPYNILWKIPKWTSWPTQYLHLNQIQINSLFAELTIRPRGIWSLSHIKAITLKSRSCSLFENPMKARDTALEKGIHVIYFNHTSVFLSRPRLIPKLKSVWQKEMQLSEHSPLNSDVRFCSDLGSPEGRAHSLYHTQSLQHPFWSPFFEHLPCCRHWAKCWSPRELTASWGEDEWGRMVSGVLY